MTACDADIIVIGGGPVGLLLAGLQGNAGRRVILIEAKSHLPTRSMAIGITPPSIEILATLNAASEFIAQGVRVGTALIHERDRIVGRLTFDGLAEPFNYILTLPQAQTVRLLHAVLQSMPTVQIIAGWQATALQQDGYRVTVTASDGESANDMTVTAPVAVGCDGAHGQVRSWLGINTPGRDYAPMFHMADYPDTSGLDADAHLFFNPERPVESFPLPAGRRRWIIRRGRNGREDLNETSETAIERLTGIRLEAQDAANVGDFRPRFALAQRFYRGRVALCGDAAHVMSPIGGQGMNTGFGDAACLAQAVDAILDGRSQPETAFSDYQRQRRRSFLIAARRSALGMTLGVAAGRTASHLRGTLLSALLGLRLSHAFAARWFAMRNLPHPATPDLS